MENRPRDNRRQTEADEGEHGQGEPEQEEEYSVRTTQAHHLLHFVMKALPNFPADCWDQSVESNGEEVHVLEHTGDGVGFAA